MAYSYDKDTDYQALINKAVSLGDYASAATYEQQRNAKINDLNAAGTNKYSAQLTNNYSQYLNADAPALSGNGGASDFSLRPDKANAVNNAYASYSNILGQQSGSNAAAYNNLLGQITSQNQTSQNSLAQIFNTPVTQSLDSLGGSGASDFSLRSDRGADAYTALMGKLGNFTGSATGVDVYTAAQEKIRQQMNENSQAWWNADDATKAQLEAANKELAALLGSGVTFDSALGTWSGMSDAPANIKPEFVFDTAKPTYESKYSDQIDVSLDKILNREAFSYDPENDPLYQSYKTQYNREGTRSMNDTLASMASSAGGMNSWAATAAQQANDYYATQLADKIPELYQLAYQMYLDDRNIDVENFGLLMDLDDTYYGRHRDEVSDWYNDRDFAYGQYRDDMGDYQWQTEFDYNAERDQIADERYDKEWQHMIDREAIEDGRYDKEWEYNTGRDSVEDGRYDQENAYAMSMDFISKGVMPSEEMLAAAGISSAMAAAMINKLFPGAAVTASASGSGGGSGGSGSGKGNGNDGNSGTGGSSGWVTQDQLGYGPINDETLEDLILDGKVEYKYDEKTGKYVYRKVEGGNGTFTGSNGSTYNPGSIIPTPSSTAKNITNTNVASGKSDIKEQREANAKQNSNSNKANATDITGTVSIGNAAMDAAEMAANWLKNLFK